MVEIMRDLSSWLFLTDYRFSEGIAESGRLVLNSFFYTSTNSMSLLIALQFLYRLRSYIIRFARVKRSSKHIYRSCLRSPISWMFEVKERFHLQFL